MNRTTTVCFTGHRQLPQGQELEQLNENLKNSIQTAIHDGYQTFLFGGCYGWDLLCANEVIALKKDHPHIAVHAIIPYEEQANDWTEEQRELYFNTMPLCDEVITLQTHFDLQCFAKRNQHMVDHSRQVIAYWNGNPRSGTAQTIHMAEKAGLEVIHISL